MLRCCLAPLCLILLSAACGDDSSEPSTIADYVQSDSRFDDLEKGLEGSDLLAALDEPGPYTLFAFEDGTTDLGDLDEVQLRDLLAYHIHEGEVSDSDLVSVTALDTLADEEIHVRFGLSGVLLDDGVEIVGEPIAASNGVIYLVNKALSRPLFTETRTYQRAPAMTTNFGYAEDTVTVDGSEFLHNLRVALDIEQRDQQGVFVYLRHEDSGNYVWLVRNPTSPLETSVTLADSATRDVETDLERGGDSGDPGPPGALYRPFDPLENLVGERLGGLWTLGVFAIGNFDDGETLLRSWSLIATAGPRMPEPAIVISPRTVRTRAFARDFREVAVVELRRVGGLGGEVELSGSVDDLLARNASIAAGDEVGALEFDVPSAAEIGPRIVTLSARIGGVSRTIRYPARVAAPQAEGLALISQVALPELGAVGGDGNDLWGWTDPESGAEIVLMGTSHGTAFVDVSKPETPVVIGILPTQSDPSLWRDIKVYDHYAYVVSEADFHGLQVFDLTRLRDAQPGEIFEPDAVANDFGAAHNIAIDENSATAYVVGSDFEGCYGGILVYDLSAPADPVAISCFSGDVTDNQPMGPGYPTDVYTHDIQCVTYAGPDPEYRGHQICVSADELSIGVADFTDPSAPKQIVRLFYDDAAYTHQGWFTEDQRYFIHNDEYDELDLDIDTRSYVWDMSDLDAPVLIGTIDNASRAIGHNCYVNGDVLYQANYTSGLRLVDVSNLESGSSSEIAYYDTHPEDDRRCKAASDCGIPEFEGAWSVYPFFASGTLAVSDMNRGLMLLRRE